MKKLATVIFILFIASGEGLPADSPKPGAAPAWFLEEIAKLTADSGRWVTDNAEYKGEQEPYDAYGMEWVSSFDGTTMSGRLFGIAEGKDTGNFWEFRLYWHPEREQAVIEQFGWGGTVGIGTMWPAGDTTKSEQTFFTVDGGANLSGHISSFPDASTHVTGGFDIDGETWTPRREYTWRLAPSTGEQSR